MRAVSRDRRFSGYKFTGITDTEIFVKFRPLLADTENLQNINYKKLGYFRDGNVC